MRGIVRCILQRLHEQRLRGICQIAGKLTHLIGHTARSKLIGDGQHLIRLQTCLQRHVTQCLVHGIFRGRQQSGTRQFLVVCSHLESGDSCQNGCRLINVARTGIAVHQFAILAVGSVTWHLLVRQLPVSVHHLRVFTQVCQRNEVTAVGGCSRLVGHPDFHTVDLDARHEVGQCRHRGVIPLAEIVGEEEVTVLFVVGHIHFKGRGLCAALGRYTLRRGFLLRQYRLQFQLTKLHIGTDTEKATGSLHERVVRGETHVTGLHEFDNLVFLALVFQFQVLGIKVKGGIGVVVQVHVYLVTHPTVHVQVDLLVEVEGCGLTVADRQRGVVDVLHRHSQLQLCRSLCLDAHTARAEYLLGRSQVEVHIGKRELVLALVLNVLHVLLAEEVAQRPFLHPLTILLGRHQHRGIQVRVADLRADIVHIGRIVILHRLTDILGVSQVDGRRVQILHHDGGCALYAEARVQKRVGDRFGQTGIKREDRIIPDHLLLRRHASQRLHARAHDQ